MQTSTGSLAALPPKQALALLLAEKVRRQQEQQAHLQQQSPIGPPPLSGSSSLVMIPGHQYNKLLTPARYKIFYGGRDSAKSWSFAEALIRLTTYLRLRVLCTREFQNSITDSVHRLLTDTINRLGVSAWFTVTQSSIRSKAGAEFIFKGIRHNVDEVKSTEGIDIAWMEEAHNTSDDSWQILIPTIRKAGSQIWATFNVTDETAPTYKRFITNTPPDTILEKVNYDQNPFLSDASRKEIAYLKRIDYQAYLHIYEGMPKKVSDAVILAGRFRVESFPDDLYKKAQRIHFGMDHGFARDPYTLIRFFMLDRKLYIEHEAYGIGIEFAGNMSDDGRGELEQLLDSVPLSRKWPIKADNARPETISFLRGKGFLCEAAEKWKGSVEDGLAHLKGFEEIIIHPRCRNTIQEGNLYSYKVDRLSGEVLPIIVDKHNHCWDAVRYGLDGHIQKGGELGIWEALGRAG